MRINHYLLYAAWIIALLATATSITLSEAFHWVPCALCWYQRIFMFPLAAILAIGILKRDRHVADYALPLAGLGVVVAGYHSLLQWGIIQEIAPCTATVACTVKQLNWLGFVTIPFLSLLSFAAITVCLVIYRRAKGRDPQLRPDAQDH